jgi:hypothetical protein
VTLESELTTFRNMVLSIIFRSTAMPECIIRKVPSQSLLALHHLHTAIEDRLGVVHRALSPEKRESKREARGFGCLTTGTISHPRAVKDRLTDWRFLDIWY